MCRGGGRVFQSAKLGVFAKLLLYLIPEEFLCTKVSLNMTRRKKGSGQENIPLEDLRLGK